MIKMQCAYLVNSGRHFVAFCDPARNLPSFPVPANILQLVPEVTIDSKSTIAKGMLANRRYSTVTLKLWEQPLSDVGN
jgi:hypothetical protein